MSALERFIFFPPIPSYGEGVAGLLRLTTASGVEIVAHHLVTPDAEATVLFAHGNAEDIGHGLPHAERYAELGVSVLSFEYPGYGLSGGEPTEDGAYEAADAAYAYLVGEAGVHPAALVAHGRSLGGAVMVDLASRRPVGGLVIESSFVSAYRVVTRAPVLPVDQFESLRKLPDVTAPVLVVHGELDTVVAPWHGRRLFQKLPEGRRSALWVEGAGHNDLAYVAGDRYWKALADFVDVVRGAGRGEGTTH